MRKYLTTYFEESRPELQRSQILSVMFNRKEFILSVIARNSVRFEQPFYSANNPFTVRLFRSIG